MRGRFPLGNNPPVYSHAIEYSGSGEHERGITPTRHSLRD